jgi:hypothetical protein
MMASSDRRTGDLTEAVLTGFQPGEGAMSCS